MDDGPCVMYVGPGGAGNFVKMVHNGIEYGDMQLISEAYDVLRTVGGFNNDEIADIFVEWNKARAPGRPVSVAHPLPVLCCNAGGPRHCFVTSVMLPHVK